MPGQGVPGPGMPGAGVPGAGTPGAGMPPGPGPKKSTGRTCLTVFLGVVGGLALLAGGGLTAHTYSNASQNVSNRTAYGPALWRNEPVDKIFPKTLGPKADAQSDPADPKLAEWHRLGIAQETGCGDALTGDLAAEADKRGCEAALRATYVDATGNLVATVAVLVLPKVDDPEKGMEGFFSEQRDKDVPSQGVKAFAVPDTLAEDWKDSRRNGTDGMQTTDTLYMPYAIAASAGSVDGRKAGHLPGEWGRRTFDAKSDRLPWREAAKTLASDLDQHLENLLLEETKPS
ncbi:hypothetical protein [Streptomyces diacarni]|nr:hypothetical protein [Streptomyces diacarni]